MIVYNESDDIIEIDNEESIGLIDIYNAVNDSSIINVIGNSYVISSSVHLLNGSNLVDKDINLVIDGNYFTIDQGCSVKFGVKNDDGSTSNGCSIYMSNPKLAYGFGSHHKDGDKTLSGDLYVYGSLIDIWCFWGFFGGDEQVVEVENCIVNGFGRIEGTNSILKDITFTKSHSRYGVLSPKGDIKVLENLSSQKSSDCSVYFNPTYTSNMKIVGGVYSNYSKLVYMEDNKDDEISVIRFTDSKVLNGFECKWGSNTKLEIANTFNPVFVDKEGSIVDLNVKVYDVNGELIVDEDSVNGEIDVELLYYKATDNDTEGSVLAPYRFAFTLADDTVIERYLNIDVPVHKVPLIVSIDQVSSGGSDVDLSALEQLIQQENQATRDYILSMNDITYQGQRIIAKYGYKVRVFVGDPSNVTLLKDYNIVMKEEDAKELYERLTVNEDDKTIDCDGMDMYAVYHACHYKNYIEKTDDVVLVKQRDMYGAMNGWKLSNYTGLLNYYYEDGEKVYTERDVDCKVYVGGEAIGGTCDFIVKDLEGNTVKETSETIEETTIKMVCKTNGKYTYEVSIKNSDDEVIYSDSGVVPLDGLVLTQRVKMLDPSLQVEVGYFNAASASTNQDHKDKLKDLLGDDYNSMDVYTDVSDDAYDARNSYNALLKRCAMGEIKNIYMWDKSELGIVRKDITLELLDVFNVSITEIKGL